MAWTIDDPSEHFQAIKWAGNSTNNRTITFTGNSDLEPDFVWTKLKDSGGNSHWAYDSTRGFAANKSISSDRDLGDGNDTDVFGYVSANASDGFVTTGGSGGDPYQYLNKSTYNYVAWAWKANGGTTTAFSAESPASGSQLAGTHQANTTSGFSIVTYTGDGGTPRTVLHGLGVAPEVIMTKRRDTTGDWIVMGDHMYHTNPWDGNSMELQSTDNSGGSKNVVGGNNPATATKFYTGDHADVNADDATYVSYCFAPKKGFSKFGIYEGIANADGPFIYTGFKPAWILIKPLDNDGYDWAMIDNARTPFNGEGVAEWLWANSSGTEFTDTDSGIDLDLDMLSNGFKITSARNEINIAATLFYMAFAEQPFVTSDGVPVTGR